MALAKMSSCNGLVLGKRRHLGTRGQTGGQAVVIGSVGRKRDGRHGKVVIGNFRSC